MAWSRAAGQLYSNLVIADNYAILPAHAGMASLGSATLPLKDLYLSNIVYVNGVPLLTDAEKVTWNGKSVVAASSTNGNLLVNGTETQVYRLPAALPATLIIEDSTHRFITDTERIQWGAGATVAASSTNGNIIVNGSEIAVYTLPNDATHRMVTDAQMSSWNNKVSASQINGNIKLDGNELTVYIHPATDGNLHVPVTGTTNNLKVLKAGSTAGAFAWGWVDFAELIGGITDTQHGNRGGGSLHTTVTQTSAGFMSISDKTKLDAISYGANKTQASTINGNIKIDGVEIAAYIHPTNHPATIITEDITHRFITDTERSAWNAKQNALGYTAEDMSKKGQPNGYADLDSLGLIPVFRLPSSIRQQTYIVADSTARGNLTGMVTGDHAYESMTGQTYIWDGSVWQLEAVGSNVVIDWGSITNKPNMAPIDIDDAVTKRHIHINKAVLDATEESFTTALLTKINGVSIGANKVTASSTNGNIKIDDVETLVYAHQDTDGTLYVPATGGTNDGKYLHAGTSAGSIAWASIQASEVTADSTHRFVTDTQVTTWNTRTTAASSTTNGNVLINGVETVVYTPQNIPASVIVADSTHRFVTDTQITAWNQGTTVTASTTNGNILVNGSELIVYTLPAALAATIITQDSTHRFVSDTEKTTWNGKSVVTASANNGNVQVNGSDVLIYTHPTTDGNLHVPATGIINNAKVLKAGASAGSLSWSQVDWSELTGRPTTANDAGLTDVVTTAVTNETMPSTGLIEGKVWYQASTDTAQMYLNGAFRNVGGVPPVVSSTIPTTSLKPGLIWYNPTAFTTKIYLNNAWQDVGGNGMALQQGRNNVTLAADSTTFAHGVVGFNKDLDIMFVHKNSTYQHRVVDWDLSLDGTQIQVLGGTWLSGSKIEIATIQAMPQNNVYTTVRLENIVNVSTAGVTNVAIGIAQYNSTSDVLDVIADGATLIPGVNYQLAADKISIDLLGYSFDVSKGPVSVLFRVWKQQRTTTSAFDGGLLVDSSVSDIKIGNRTADQTVVATGNTGKLGDFTNWFANRFKSNQGTTNWYDAPRTTLANAVKLNGDNMVSISSTANVLGLARGTQSGGDVNMPTDFGSPYLRVGGSEYNLNSFHTIGFGYSTDATFPKPAGIGMVTTDATGSTKGDLVFGTRSTTTNIAPTERMRINSDGHVRIGTGNPLYAWVAGMTMLSIKGSSHMGMLEMSSTLADADQQGFGHIQFMDNNLTSVDKRSAAITSQTDGTTVNNRGGSIGFWTKPDGVTSIVERMRIDRNGNVAIGTSVPGTYTFQTYRNVNSSTVNLFINKSNGANAYSGLMIGNDTADNKLVMFVNSSARTADGGAGNSTIRTDSGGLTLGAAGAGIVSIGSDQKVTITSASTGYYGNLSFVPTTAGHTSGLWLRNYETGSSGQGGFLLYNDGTSIYDGWQRRVVLAATANSTAGTGTRGVAISLQGSSEGTQDFRIINSNNLSGTVFTVTQLGRVTISGVGTSAEVVGGGGQLHIIGGYASPVSGKVIIGDASGWKMVFSSRTAAGVTTDVAQFYDDGRAIFNSTVTATSFPTSSDRALKENIVPITDALLKIKQINGITFDWNDLYSYSHGDQRQAGVIAQDVEAVLPEIIHIGDDGYKQIDYSKLTPLLIEAVKELDQKVKDLEAQNAAFEARLKAIEEKMNS